VKSTDPQREKIKYEVDWGDKTSLMTTLYNSGEEVKVTGGWRKSGIYQVKVRAIDEHGTKSSWSKPLTVVVREGNQPPRKPFQPQGETSVKRGVPYTYSAVTTDPDGDRIMYQFRVGGRWLSTSYVASGEKVSISYSWLRPGQVEVRAIDEHGAISEWSDPLTVHVINSPPTKPSLSGPAVVKVNWSYTYSAISTDPEGDKIRYKFDWGDGTIYENKGSYYPSGEKAHEVYSWKNTGTYTVKVKAIDEYGAESGWSDPLQVTVVDNFPPYTPSKPSGETSVIVGRPYYYYVKAQQPQDPDWDEVKFRFDFGDGTVEETDYKIPNQEAGLYHTWKNTGEYTVKVKAIDVHGAESGWSKGLIVKVINNPPHPITGGYSATVLVNKSVEFSLKGSDPDHHRIKFRIDWGDTDCIDTDYVYSGQWVTVSKSWSTPGTYNVKVQVIDEYGAKSEWTDPWYTVIVRENDPPIPSKPQHLYPASMSQTSEEQYMVTGKSYVFSFNASDPDGDSVRFVINWGDDTETTVPEHGYYPSGQGATASHTWNNPGTYEVKVKAIDEHGAESGWSEGLTVDIRGNVPPSTPSRPSGPTSIVVGESNVYSTKSVDPNGGKIQYEFDWGDGTRTVLGLVPSSSKFSTGYFWKKPGTYEVKVRAKDVYGAVSSWSSPLTVTVKANGQPKAPPQPSGPTSVNPGVAYVYTTQTTDPEGHDLIYTFKWGDNSTTNTIYASGEKAVAFHSWQKPGTYQVKVGVMDKPTWTLMKHGYGGGPAWSVPFTVSVSEAITNQAPHIDFFSISSREIERGSPRRMPNETIMIEAGKSLNFSVSGTDPDGDKIKYMFRWGDGTITETNYVSSKEMVEVSHSWKEEGIYFVAVMAVDERGATLGWHEQQRIIVKK
jgi:hypothetical protein